MRVFARDFALTQPSRSFSHNPYVLYCPRVYNIKCAREVNFPTSGRSRLPDMKIPFRTAPILLTAFLIYFFVCVAGADAGGACAPGQFRCPEGKCISSQLVCNYQKDCEKGEDEYQSCRKSIFSISSSPPQMQFVIKASASNSLSLNAHVLMNGYGAHTKKCSLERVYFFISCCAVDTLIFHQSRSFRVL